MIVDEGRYGYGGIGVPWSFALDHTAFGAANYLVGNNPGSL
jgi:allophanate hydrolase subunit 2